MAHDFASTRPDTSPDANALEHAASRADTQFQKAINNGVSARISTERKDMPVEISEFETAREELWELVESHGLNSLTSVVLEHQQIGELKTALDIAARNAYQLLTESGSPLIGDRHVRARFEAKHGLLVDSLRELNETSDAGSSDQPAEGPAIYGELWNAAQHAKDNDQLSKQELEDILDGIERVDESLDHVRYLIGSVLRTASAVSKRFDTSGVDQPDRHLIEVVVGAGTGADSLNIDVYELPPLPDELRGASDLATAHLDSSAIERARTDWASETKSALLMRLTTAQGLASRMGRPIDTTAHTVFEQSVEELSYLAAQAVVESQQQTSTGDVDAIGERVQELFRNMSAVAEQLHDEHPVVLHLVTTNLFDEIEARTAVLGSLSLAGRRAHADFARRAQV